MRRALRRLCRQDGAGWGPPPRRAGPYLPWLREDGSLTARVIRHLAQPADFSLRVLYQGSARLGREEARLLGLRPGRRVQVREILLLGRAMPLVYAHSVLPASSRRHPWPAWYGLGNRALGSLLFACPKIIAGPLACRALDRRHPLRQRAAGWLEELPALVWGRRAVFRQDGFPLLVSELFLPPLLDLK